MGEPSGDSSDLKSVMPQVHLEDDAPNSIMSSYGFLLGFSRQRAVWRFGFAPGSQLSLRCQVCTLHPLWALSLHNGTVIETFIGLWTDSPPSRFQNILGASL